MRRLRLAEPPRRAWLDDNIQTAWKAFALQAVGHTGSGLTSAPSPKPPQLLPCGLACRFGRPLLAEQSFVTSAEYTGWQPLSTAFGCSGITNALRQAIRPLGPGSCLHRWHASRPPGLARTADALREDPRGRAGRSGAQPRGDLRPDQRRATGIRSSQRRPVRRGDGRRSGPSSWENTRRQKYNQPGKLSPSRLSITWHS